MNPAALKEEVRGSIRDVSFACVDTDVKYMDSQLPWMTVSNVDAIITLAVRSFKSGSQQTAATFVVGACMPYGYRLLIPSGTTYTMNSDDKWYSTLNALLIAESPDYSQLREDYILAKLAAMEDQSVSARDPSGDGYESDDDSDEDPNLLIE